MDRGSSTSATSCGWPLSPGFSSRPSAQSRWWLWVGPVRGTMAGTTRGTLVGADIVIRGGLVVDGTGAPPRRADVAITGDRISAIGDKLDGRSVIDADGC